MPPFKFADAQLGRRVELCGFAPGSPRALRLNGQCATVVEIKPAAGRYVVELDDLELVGLSARHLRRPFVASLDEGLASKPPPEPVKVAYRVDPELPLGLEAEFDTLVVSKVFLPSF